MLLKISADCIGQWPCLNTISVNVVDLCIILGVKLINGVVKT
jgi:hypothetical protein